MYRTASPTRLLRLLIRTSLWTTWLFGGCSLYDKTLVEDIEGVEPGPARPDAGMAQAGSGAGGGGVGGNATLPDAGMRPNEPWTEDCSTGDCFWSGRAGSNTCRSAGVPDERWRPTDTAAGNVGDVYLGLTRLWLGGTRIDGDNDPEAWRGFGLDLDGVCTNSETCLGPDEAAPTMSCRAASAQLPFDGDLCRDNTFGRLQPVAASVPEIGGVFGLSEDVFNCELWRGSFNMIMKLSGYNGRADDAQVRVDFYPSPGLADAPEWQCPLQDARETRAPWDAAARWSVDGASLAGSIANDGSWPPSRSFAADAYVRHGYLVARLPDGMQFALAGPGAAYPGWSMELVQGYWVGRLERDEGRWQIRDGLVAGRIPADALLLSFREIGLCASGDTDFYYQAVSEYVRDNADLLVSGALDPEQPCDAMSVAIAFEASQVAPGPAATTDTRVDCCLPEYLDTPQCKVGCGDGRVFGEELCDTAIPAGEPGACPTACPYDDACRPRHVEGEDCQARCVDSPVPAPDLDSTDGCCPPGANANTDADCTPTCGNAVIEGDETCDPISSCPSEATCVPVDSCDVVVFRGAPQYCSAVCERSTITACSGAEADGCCPDACQSETEDATYDVDCPSACDSDGHEPGEICYDSAGESYPCPHDPIVDCTEGGACTTAAIAGSAERCTARCTYTPITAPSGATQDGCCPPGANANTDADCDAVCGNGIVEPGETCDDGNRINLDGCSSTCQMESPEVLCLGLIGEGPADACRECTCRVCATEALECYVNYSDTANQRCADVVACGRESGCTDHRCYCGTHSRICCESNLVSSLVCLLSGGTGGDGPCKAPIRAAGESTSASTLLSRQTDTSYPLGRANVFGACIAANTECATVCGVN